ncbi:SET domain-containing protein SmydA-8-like isoform X2 [Toxorhynchites rutilus septentrionalis]|uniref:SET domain-containing protein SmydA-8-like isoform X2 n=1 Tax=Toxorhynchites rutilus septentrionalis TaxID=329112 RepID=UPI00247A9C68|nr:SET domain-containing protein SmydA-8-like isoform X2 [Toxorhynchites rutilus septentrionalis]
MARFDENCVVLKSDSLGRFLVAKRDLASGQQVMVEEPIVVGPYWDSEICCLNCFKRSCTICRKCRRAPLCYDCSSHSEAECEFYRKSNLDINFLFNHFNVVTPVRCLLLAESDPEKFREVMNMEAHLEERRGTEVWDNYGKHTVQPLLECGAFEKLETDVQITEQVIQHICGVFDVNSFEIRGCADDLDGQASNTVRGLYPRTALMTHSCVPNTLISVDGSSSLRLYTTVPVKEGELLYYNYTRCLFGTFERRAHLRKGKYFICTCPRCEDPTELGTHLSSVRCTACGEGLCSYHSKESKWKCEKCSQEINREYVKQVLTAARNDAMTCSLDIQELEQQALAGELRNLCVSSHPSNIPQKILARKAELCGEILEVLRVLEPGISRLTGIALYEFNVSQWDLARKKFESKAIKSKDLLETLTSAENGLKESVRMLLLDHPSTPEGRLSKRAMHELKELRGEIAQIRMIIGDEKESKSKQFVKKSGKKQ